MKVEWIKVEDALPQQRDDGVKLYVVEYGKVRDDVMWHEWGVNWDTCSTEDKTFVTPNSDSEYGGLFSTNGVTHWARKTLPEPPQ